MSCWDGSTRHMRLLTRSEQAGVAQAFGLPDEQRTWPVGMRIDHVGIWGCPQIPT